MSCQGFVQCILKLLNILVALVGAYMILYSLWMLKEWQSDTVSTIESAMTTALSDGLPILGDGKLNILGDISYQQLGRPFISIGKWGLALPNIPPPWFIYAILGAGIITSFVALIGHIAAETSHGFCLSSYSFFQVVLLIAQFAIAGCIFFDHHWREDIPEDPTGELDKVEKFVEENLDICKWAALSVVVMEVSRSSVSTIVMQSYCLLNSGSSIGQSVVYGYCQHSFGYGSETSRGSLVA